MNELDKYWNILQFNIDWLKFSETKASILLTVYGIIITIVYSNSQDVLNGIRASYLLIILTILAALLSILSIYFAFKCINPRLNNSSSQSIIYYGDIAKKYKDFNQYQKAAVEIVEEDSKFKISILAQIHVNSNIAWRKFVNVTWALRFFMSSIVVLIIELIIYLF